MSRILQPLQSKTKAPSVGRSLDSGVSDTSAPTSVPDLNLGERTGKEQMAGINKIGGSISKGAADIQAGMEKGGIKGVPDTLKGVAEGAFGTITGAAETALAPITAGLGPTLQKITEAVGSKLRSDNPQLAKAYDTIVPKIQDWASKHPDASTLAGDIANTLLLAVGGGASESAVKDTLKESFSKESLTGAKKDIVDMAGNIKNKITDAPKNIKAKVGDIAYGKEAKFKAGKISAPETQEFVPKAEGGKGRTFNSVVENTKKAIKTFQEKSIKALSDVKSKITGNHFKQPDVAQVINDKITSVLGNKVNARGLKGFDLTSASVDELKSYGLINDQEEKLMRGMVKMLQDNPDISDRGILNAKEDLYKKYYKAGNQDYATSNKIVKSIYDGLNDLVGSANKSLKPALDAASKNITDGEAMQKQLLGKGAEVEAKLKSIATHLKDGAVNADDIKLIQQLEKETGIKILPDLEGYGNYQELLAEKNKTGKFPTAKGTKTKALVGTLKKAGVGAIGVGAYESIKHLGVPLP